MCLLVAAHNSSMLEGKVSAALSLHYGAERKMSTVPFNHLASNHLVIIPLQRLAEAEGKKERGQQRETRRRQHVTMKWREEKKTEGVGATACH